MGNKTKETLKKFDEFLIENGTRPVVMADRLSCIVGVLIDIKPACVIDFMDDDMKNINIKTFSKWLEDLGLRYYYEKTDLDKSFDPTFTHTFYISKSEETLNMLVDAEHELYDHFSTDEPDSPLIKIMHQRIGRLLGYPETAIDWFLIRAERIDKNEMDDDEVFKDLQKYHHYIHSRNNGEDEFEEYDKPIHEAMEESAPKSAEILRESSNEKRWL